MTASTYQIHLPCDTQIAGSYDLVETIGKGHFAVVKLARHVFTGERVAVKIIDKNKLDPVSRDHLYQEVICMKLVQHPNVVRLYEVIDTTNKLYLVQEWGDGGDLYDHIMRHERGLNEIQCRMFFSQIVQAISYCHKLHVVHRDLKPENVIFFADTGIVKLTDFGFSNKYTPGNPLDTSCGSLAYSAPEILLGDAYDPPKVDIWSLGVILYMLVCGNLPFNEANDSETLIKIMDCCYAIPSHVTPSCRCLIEAMLRRNPNDRISLEEILSHPWLSIGGQANESLQSSQSSNSSTNIANSRFSVPLLSQQGLTFEDHMEILNIMADGHLASQADIQTALESNCYDYITATYYLLAERKLARRQRLTQCALETMGMNAEEDSSGTDLDGEDSVVLMTSSITPISAALQTPVRILSSDVAADGPEERLRRFSCILEDQEEEEDEEAGESMFSNAPGIQVINEFILEDLPEEDTSPLVSLSETCPSTQSNVKYGTVHSSDAFFRRPSIHDQLVGGGLSSFGNGKSYEIYEDIELKSDGVASLRYSSSFRKPRSRRLSSGANSFHMRRRPVTLSQSRSMPQLEKSVLEKQASVNLTGSVVPKGKNTCERRPRNSWHVLGPFADSTVVTASLLRRRKDGVVASGMASAFGNVSSDGSSLHGNTSSWRYKMKRRSLPPLSSTSPLTFHRRKIRLSHVGLPNNATSSVVSYPHAYSSSSDNSDSESGFFVEAAIPTYEIRETEGPQSGVIVAGSNQKNHAFTRKKRIVANIPAQSTLRSSSGGNLRDQCAPIKEDEETPPFLSTSRFHPSFSMTPTPCPSGWVGAPDSALGRPSSETGRNAVLEFASRRRSDYGRTLSVGGNSETPIRHSVHGVVSYRNSVVTPNANSSLVYPPNFGKFTSASSINQSNFSLSSVASSLRGSKMMMDVIRGAFELQLHTQRSKAASSLSSSTSRQDRLDTACISSQQPSQFESSVRVGGDSPSSPISHHKSEKLQSSRCSRLRHGIGNTSLTTTCCIRSKKGKCDEIDEHESSPETGRSTLTESHRCYHHSYSNPVTPSTSLKCVKKWERRGIDGVPTGGFEKSTIVKTPRPLGMTPQRLTNVPPTLPEKPSHQLLSEHKIRAKVNCCSVS